MLKKIFSLCAVVLLLYETAYATVSSRPESITFDKIAAVIEYYRQEIPQRMIEQDIPGLAVVVVDDTSIL